MSETLTSADGSESPSARVSVENIGPAVTPAGPSNAGLFSTARRRLKKRLENAIGEAPSDPLGLLEAIIAESDLNAFDCRRASVRWGRAFYLLGLPGAVLATLAGATGLATTTGRVPAAVIALVSACLTAAGAFLNSEQNRKKSDDLSAAWQELGDDARIRLLTCLAQLNGEARSTFVPTVTFWELNLWLLQRKAKLLRGDLEPVKQAPRTVHQVTEQTTTTRTRPDRNRVVVTSTRGASGTVGGPGTRAADTEGDGGNETVTDDGPQPEPDTTGVDGVHVTT